MHRKQSGFTIVELVVVIILLGILAATALPRFINIDDEAYGAAFKAVQGSLQTGVSMAHAAAIAEDAQANDVLTDYGLFVNASGFPYGLTDNSGGTSTVTTAQDCVDVFETVQQAGAPSIATNPDSATLDTAFVGGEDFAAVVNAPNCEYYHTAQSTTNGDQIGMLTYNSATGEVTDSLFTIN